MNDPAPSAFEQLGAAISILRSGGVVAFPTETVYGLGADALNPHAVQRVFDLKGRPSHNPLIVHVSGPEMARRVASDWPADAARLAAAFWPGPLSIIVPKRPELPDIVTGGGATVAVRCPDHPVALALLYQFGQPLVGPSANRSGAISPTTAQHVRDSFPNTDLLILDGGACSTGIESTVVSVLDAEPRILRAGVISADQIAAALDKPVHTNPPAAPTTDSSESPAPLLSPGLLSRHYAPNVPTRLLTSDEIIDVLAASPSGPAHLILGRTIPSVPSPHRLIPMPYASSDYAAILYAALRLAESAAPAEILIETPPADDPTWHAIWDRLRRACAE